MKWGSGSNRWSCRTSILPPLVADVKFDIAYAALHNAYANVFASVGLDPYHPGNLDTSLTVKALARSLKKLWLERGDHHSRI